MSASFVENGGPIYPAPRLDGDDQEIRHLTLLPGDFDDAVNCRLDNVPLKDGASYDALSYAWGSSECPRAILVNGSEVKVGENLFQALKHLRLQGNARVLWVDAICINQSDVAERNHQVRQMADIFRLAHQVVAWIGSESTSSKAAFEFLRNAYEFSPHNRKGLMEHPGWGALGELCQREYWGRVWIVQEICLATRLVVVCGPIQAPWQHFSELRTSRKHIWPQYLSPGERDFMKSLPARIDEQKEIKRKNGCVLWTLLEVFQKSGCKDFHDRVYGFLGLSSDCRSEGIPIDYSKTASQLYEDIMLFYQERFQAKDPPHGAQLMKLGVFLHELLAPHLDLRTLGPRSDDTELHQMLDISANNVMVIQSFPNAEQAGQHRASELVNFLQGLTPYSHLGSWRNFLDPDINGVRAVSCSRTYASKCRARTPQRPGQKTSRPSAFVANSVEDASQTRDGDNGVGRQKLGVAPAGSQVGDIVCTFLDSHIALVFRQTEEVETTSRTDDSREALERRRFALVGRATVYTPDENPFEKYVSRLNFDKTVETIQARLLDMGLDADPWPATISIEVSTLQQLTLGRNSFSPRGSSKVMLDLMPTAESRGAAQQGGTANSTRPRLSDDELEKLQKDSQLKKHALGPGYAGIINLGATGYLSCVLQMLYMLKPFRKAVLDNPDSTGESAHLKALRDIFRQLNSTSLPVSPVALTNAFGWDDRELNRPRDILDFWREFTGTSHDWLGTASEYAFAGLFRGSIITRTLLDWGSKFTRNARREDFWELHYYTTSFRTLPDALRDYGVNDSKPSDKDPLPHYVNSRVEFQQVPPALLLQGSFFVYSHTENRMVTYNGAFEYPPVLRLSDVFQVTKGIDASDWTYQLHGAAILEDVKPMARWLLYLRPRRENQWLLFFNETVTYALEREVFEDNFGPFGSYAKSASSDLPSRRPMFLLYLRVSLLDDILDR